MSNINVRRAVENIRSGTNVYTPLVETVVNAIQAIEAGSPQAGRVDILVKRSNQQELEGGQTLFSLCGVCYGAICDRLVFTKETQEMTKNTKHWRR